MFTGLVEALGTVHAVIAEPPGCRLVIEQRTMAGELELGESVAVNGACLSVVECTADRFAFQAGPETLAKTNLGTLRPGDAVNLERALRVGDRLGGHWVQGHVDGVGTIVEQEVQGEWQMVAFRAAPALLRYLAPKGSIAVDGVSLTVVEVGPTTFRVMLIPQTLERTTLGRKRVGDPVNLETDILAKYVERLLAPTS